MKIKICGITNVGDAIAAVEAGADALGFIFYQKSPRYIAPAAAAEIVSGLPPFVGTVGVFVNAPEAVVRQIVEETRINTLQFHGDETPEFCQEYRETTIKAVRVKDRQSLSLIERYETHAWLLDTYVPGKLGGTSQTFDWSIVGDARCLQRPVILAGGLNPKNVQDAIQQVHPYAVDVSGGVETTPGKKDASLIREFIQRVRSADG